MSLNVSSANGQVCLRSAVWVCPSGYRTKHSRHRRALCEMQARHRFGTAARARKSTDAKPRSR